MKKVLCMLLIFSLTLILAEMAAASTVEVNLSAGEQFVIPEGRRGEAAADDDTIVQVSGDTVTALRPGRTTVRVSGPVQTDFVFLVLYPGSESATEPALQETAAPSAEVPSAVSLPGETGEGEAEVFIQLPGETPDSGTEEPAAAPAPDLPEPSPETDVLPEPEDGGPAYQHYDRSAVPEEINGAIDLAFTQWTEDADGGTKKFSRLGKYNKYSYWQCGSGSGCDIGWCGAFLGYVYDNAGIPMDVPAESVPHEGGVPYAVRAAGVGKIYTGFSNMERLSMIPRPGYFVVYGQQKGYAYKHIGLVVDADELEDGTWLIKTIEGNMSSTIRRYCYLFDSGEQIKNLKPCPDEYVRDDAGINAYQHVSNWNITAFCQTWLPEEP